MKCPRLSCGNEVAHLTRHPSTAVQYPNGLCDTCDAIERATDVPLRQGSPLRGQPPVASETPARTKRKYTRRTPPEKKEARPAKTPRAVEHEPVPTTLGILEKIRLGYGDEVKKAEQALKIAQDSFDIATEILDQVTAAQ